MKRLFNDGWKFTKQEVFTSLETIDQDNIFWSDVDIPHDWLIYNTNDLYETSEGWYKKNFTLANMENQVISICFEGVYMDSTVYVNNVVVGEWKYGYSTFEFDITNYLKIGENEIKVKVVYQNLNTRWYSGAGIYRNVYLKTTALTHFVTDGIYISTKKEDNGFQVCVESESMNQSGFDTNASIKHSILDCEGNVVTISEQNISLEKRADINSKLKNLQTLFVENPNLWDIKSPYLYKVKSELLINGSTVDEVEQNIGFRTLRFDCNEGFFLNDNYVKLHGACQHHDLGALGAAVNKVAIRRQFEMLQEMGVNSVRTSHNMPSVELMDLADEMGMLIVSESFDMWERPKTEFDYARFFLEWCERDVASWVRRDRNHPSIIMWSIGNEIYDTHASDRGLYVTKMLRDFVLEHDPNQNGYVTIGSNFMSGENAQICSNELPVAGYNYGEYLYEEHHKKYPHWVIYGSETASTIQSRGIYHFPADKTVVTHEDEQCSSLGNCSTSWGANNTQQNIITDRDAKYCLGQYIWTGFDYIGEPTPYFTKNSYFGQIDTAGFKKDSFYLYQAEWTDYKTNPMVHLLPYWDFNEGQLIDIRIYSNAPKTELFFNDKSLGVYEIDHVNGKQLSGEWKIPYQKGTLKAVAYDELNQIIATDIQSSFSDAAKIVLKPNKNTIQANGLDMIFVEISMIDKDGNSVANANNRVEVLVSGAGRLVGLDNGDSTDYDSYKGTSRKLFSGKLIAMIAAKTEPGDITFKVTSEGLNAEELRLEAIKAEKIHGISAYTENVKSEFKKEIPIRKIELTNHGRNHLDKENPTTKISANLFPLNTTYEEIEWKAMTLSGIITNIAKIEANGTEAVITALGDGEFRLRCTAKNGRKNPEIISELEFEISGVGNAVMNPYEYVSAGLYNAGNREFNSGLLGGIATDNTQNYVGFKGIDFGDYGSDEVTIPIFYLSNDPAPIEIWEGVPGEADATLLLDTVYHKDFIWNTYVPETFKLPKRLKGITTVCFGLKNKLDFQGFQFTHYEKAFEKLWIKENTRIYGDSYTIMDDAIEKIGNNVAIEFEQMDFGDKGFTKIRICGKSRNDVNTIHVHFTNEETNGNQIVEVPYTEDYVEHEFSLDSVKGKHKVSFMFLPGSNFDFKWFQFIK
ncbi:MAG: glycoside hydrolase [Anaerocolumna sp.]|jgi:beta-galactosidase|nr:glycoside hydrolase [Anaerocolumna sp.]